LLKPRKLPSGKYQARFLAPDGSIQTAGTHATLKAAKSMTAGKLADIARGVWDDGTAGTQLFSEFAARVVELRSGNLNPRSLLNYEASIRNHLLPTFGRKRLRDIQAIDIDLWWAKQPATPGRKNNYRVLSNIMKFAVKYREITTTPCQVDKAGKDTSKPRPYLDLDGLARVLSMCDPFMRTFVLVTMGASLRVGEAIGLDRNNINLSTGQIDVVQQMVYSPGGAVLDTPKNDHQRTVTLLGPALEALREHLKAHPSIGGTPVFTNASGGRVSRAHIYREWKKIRHDAGFPWLHIHDLRHTGLTVFAQSGATLKETMDRGGHSTPTIAMRYQHSAAGRETAVSAIATKMLKEAVG